MPLRRHYLKPFYKRNTKDYAYLQGGETSKTLVLKGIEQLVMIAATPALVTTSLFYKDMVSIAINFSLMILGLIYQTYKIAQYPYEAPTHFTGLIVLLLAAAISLHIVMPHFLEAASVAAFFSALNYVSVSVNIANYVNNFVLFPISNFILLKLQECGFIRQGERSHFEIDREKDIAVAQLMIQNNRVVSKSTERKEKDAVHFSNKIIRYLHHEKLRKTELKLFSSFTKQNKIGKFKKLLYMITHDGKLDDALDYLKDKRKLGQAKIKIITEKENELKDVHNKWMGEKTKENLVAYNAILSARTSYSRASEYDLERKEDPQQSPLHSSALTLFEELARKKQKKIDEISALLEPFEVKRDISP